MFKNEFDGREAYFIDGGRGEHVSSPMPPIQAPIQYRSFFNETVLIVSPSITLTKRVSQRLSFTNTLTYNFISSDGFDGYSFSTESNDKDYYYSIKLGLQWQLGKIKYFQSNQQESSLKLFHSHLNQ